MIASCAAVAFVNGMHFEIGNGYTHESDIYMHISFHGAARTVTGTKHLVHFDNGQQLLLDCGMFQGMGAATASLNENFGFDPEAVTAMVLSHAHIDHSGLIPKLVKDGFGGKIYCTPATRELAELLLIDSAGIQQYEADTQNKKQSSNGLDPVVPLYTLEDVQACFSRFEEVQYDIPFQPLNDVTVVLSNTGHLIGSASIHLAALESGKEVTVLFSGDVGRFRSTLLQRPVAFPPAAFIILESTYGNSTHSLVISAVEPLLQWIKRACVEKKGKLIIPAFSVGRTQELLYALNQLELEKRLPELMYFVDSPLSKRATDVIKHHLDQFNDRLQQVLQKDDDPFHFAGLKYVDTVEDSQLLTNYDKPCVIISAGGTGDAGRVRHHLYAAIQDQRNTVLFVGYCQEQSTGGQLLRGAKTIELFGESCEVAAEIAALQSMSAHGDTDDLVKFLSCQPAESVKQIFLVHGEYATQQAFAATLERKGYSSVSIPEMHAAVALV